MDVRKQLREQFLRDSVISILAVMDDDILDLLGLDPSIRASINEQKTGDDTMGKAMALFGFFITNTDLTDQDRLVVGQSAAVISACALRKRVATKQIFDAEDVLQNKTVLTGLIDWFDAAPFTMRCFGDARNEQVVKLTEYIEQYDRDVKDKARKYIDLGEKNEDESASEGGMLDWVPFVGE